MDRKSFPSIMENQKNNFEKFLMKLPIMLLQ